MEKTNMTILDEVKARMNELQEIKAADLETIRQKQADARTQIEAAELTMKQAAEEMDVDHYAEAKNAKVMAETALDMLARRYDQIKAREVISEADSDAVIDSLLEYENQLAEDFKAAAGVQLKKLAELLKDYKAAVQDVESTLTSWQRDVHANYNTRGGSAFFDEFTGHHTHRSPQPVPVHRVAYTGCAEAGRMEEYLKKEAQLVEG